MRVAGRVPSKTVQVVKLGPGDEARLDAFLLPRAESSMFLLTHRQGGLVDEGKPQQAIWVAAIEDSTIAGVAAHSTNGWLHLQASNHADVLAREATRISARPVKAIVGPYPEMLRARAALGMDDRPAEITSRQELFALQLAKLRVPAALVDGRVTCRHSRDDELDLLARWRAEYLAEAMGTKPGAELDAAARRDVTSLHGKRDLFVLVADGATVCCGAFNARVPGMVQVGGVYTPPESRGRGYARAVVAGQLVEAREQGASRSILFTDTPAARVAYLAIGFEIVGEFGFVFFSYA